MEDDLTKILNFMYNPIEDFTVITIKGTRIRRSCVVRGQFERFEELPDTAKESVKRLYREVYATNFEGHAAYSPGPSYINNMNMLSGHSNLGSAIVELNIENATLLKYIKELYGEFIENDLSTEETLNAKQLTIKEWLEK